ncbi:MAG: 4Fe-4S dicluster domain-containing protein [Deltaproteobacteria bacterium]|jgi:carbon-monoxide dehydrogenase iron sulfur subunit|nr:4Fe-4S dicluster domain-containing protein [Deltaproteobacteria bacterium]MBW2572074.1 4Fe-4S dicluster domain-containing protein [Deltaproteobacteria bacterium]MBW2669101.1 4Fe-4S dicluster domain-containing protein [Deltaproteobacteria bacterium]
MPQPKEIFVRLDRCMGCYTCEVACTVEHSRNKNLYSAISERPVPKKRVYVEWVAPDGRIPVLCRHCEDAPCMHACISGAISRTDEGVVFTNVDKCIGCWTCVMVCPYGVIGRHMEEHKAYRCDRCPDRQSPACVDACPTKALVYRTVEDYSSDVRKTASREMLSGEGG